MYRTTAPTTPMTVVKIPSKHSARKSRQAVSREKSSTLTTTLLMVAGFIFLLLFLGLLGYGISEAVKNSERHGGDPPSDRPPDGRFRTYDPSVQIPISLSDYQQFQILKNAPSTCTPQFCKSTYNLITQGECPEPDNDCTPCTPDYCQSTFALIPKNSVSIYDPTKQTPIPIDTYNSMKTDLELQKKATTDAEEKNKQLQTQLDGNQNCQLPICKTRYPLRTLVFHEGDPVDASKFCLDGRPCVFQALVVKQFDGSYVDVTQAVQTYIDSDSKSPRYFSYDEKTLFPMYTKDPFVGNLKFLYIVYACVPRDQKCS